MPSVCDVLIEWCGVNSLSHPGGSSYVYIFLCPANACLTGFSFLSGLSVRSGPWQQQVAFHELMGGRGGVIACNAGGGGRGRMWVTKRCCRHGRCA